MAHVLGTSDLDKNPTDRVPQFTQLAQGNVGFEPRPGFSKPSSCPASHCLPGRVNEPLPRKAASPLKFLRATILIVRGKEGAKLSLDSVCSQVLCKLCLE